LAETKEWSGPIFSQKSAAGAKAAGGEEYTGWIPGTFSEETIGINDSPRAPDLIVSFRESPETTNLGLTGPQNPAFAIGAKGRQPMQNLSAALVRPVEGTVYSDTRYEGHLTTGMGMHGAAGAREIHNFCAAVGPDFRRHFIDAAPTGNLDVNATIRELLRQPGVAGASGRVMREALSSESRIGPPPHRFARTVFVVLEGMETSTTLKFTRFEGEDYLDGSSVTRTARPGAP